MTPDFNGIERRLDRLRPMQEKTLAEFAKDAYLRDIVDRNLEVAAQCCIDICHRIIVLERVLVGAVSTVNDDASDNRFYGKVGRFPEIDEDEGPSICWWGIMIGIIGKFNSCRIPIAFCPWHNPLI